MSRNMFGNMIRGARQRFVWLEAIQNFVRISGDGPFLVEMAAPDHLPSGHRGKHERAMYRMGWEREPEIRSVIEALPRTTSRVALYLDDEGQRIGGAA